MDTPSHGLLILGMHRSGTSALARLVGLGGADLGDRLLGASPGNDTGHWEDAFAVDQHERLLAAFGARWDDPFALPAAWRTSDAGREAVAAIGAYLAGDRAARSLWALKDPRLCLFAPAWREAAAAAGQPLSAVLLLRHPGEVAESLAVRDGMASARAHLLWLEHTHAAIEAADGLPAVLLRYDQVLADWRGALRRLAGLPGAGRLADTARYGQAVDAFLDASRRHHHATGDAGLPPMVAEAWRALSADAEAHAARPGPEARAALAKALAALREPAAPWLAEARGQRRRLEARAACAEAALAANAPALRLDLRELRSRIDQHQQVLVRAISNDLRTMQAQVEQARRDMHASAQAEAAAREAKAQADARSAHLQAEADERLARARADAAAQRARAEAETAAVRRDLAEAQARLVRELAAQESRLAQAREELATLRHALAAARHELGERREDSRQLAMVRASRSWRWTRPLRALGRWLRGEWRRSDRDAMVHVLRGAVARTPLIGRGLRRGIAQHAMPAPGCPLMQLPGPGELHVVPLAAPGPLPDVFIGAVIDWNFRTQRPQHLARALARRGHRVFYLSNNFIDAAEPGFRVQPLGEDGRLFQVHLDLAGKPPIYFGMPDAAQVEGLRASLAELLAWTSTTSSVFMVQHPYWRPLARLLPSARVVYDCMDHHGGFENNAPAVLEAEQALVRDADLVVVSSAWLDDAVRPQARATCLVRNAGEFGFFSAAPPRRHVDPRGRPVIGYYGAIAEWFDVGLVREVAVAFPDAAIVLVGNDTAGVGAALADLPNVQMVGEVPYAELPYWLHGFDACLLPFRRIPLTLATNPVKVYEYLAAGKPVVAVDLPEMAQFDGRVATAGDAAGFIAEIAGALAEGADDPRRQARRDFAASQTWSHRAEVLGQALDALEEPVVSVVVLTYNNLAFTEACLFSLEAYSDYRRLEVVVVDNASTDGSREWLRRWAAEPSAAGHRRRLLLNEANLGFAAGNNVGLRAATGEVLVMLNNDTYVTPGWVRGLCNHLRRDPGLGLVGPVTNNIGNEARIGIAYADMTAMIREAGAYTRAHAGLRYPLRTAAFFCVAMRRETFQRVGPLDEAFGLGFFEDDDYCRRIEAAGLSVACAEDVFVHHHLSASFDALKVERRQALFEANKALYEAKWGTWVPHAYRPAGADGVRA